jgi:hypothetical protein
MGEEFKMGTEKNKTLSFRIKPEVHKDLKIISLNNEITIQQMGEVFVYLYLNDYLKLYRPGRISITNQKKLYRDSDESTVTFRVSEETHSELRDKLKYKKMTFQQIAEKFFKIMTKNNRNDYIDMGDIEYNKLPDDYNRAVLIFEDPYDHW